MQTCEGCGRECPELPAPKNPKKRLFRLCKECSRRGGGWFSSSVDQGRLGEPVRVRSGGGWWLVSGWWGRELEEDGFQVEEL